MQHNVENDEVIYINDVAYKRVQSSINEEDEKNNKMNGIANMMETNYSYQTMSIPYKHAKSIPSKTRNDKNKEKNVTFCEILQDNIDEYKRIPSKKPNKYNLIYGRINLFIILYLCFIPIMINQNIETSSIHDNELIISFSIFYYFRYSLYIDILFIP